MSTGLIFRGSSENFVLENSDLTAHLTGLTYTLQCKLNYKNVSGYALEATYVIPINDVAIYNFEAKVDDRKLVCVCRPRSEAKATQQEAKAKGHCTIFVETDEQTDDRFQVTIGNVPPNAKIEISYKCVGYLDAKNIQEGDGIHGKLTLVIPEVLRPRYSPTNDAREFQKLDDTTTIKRPKSRLTLGGTLNMPCPIVNVFSSKDAFTTTFTSEDHRMAEFDLSDPFYPDHDLELEVTLKDQLSFAVLLERGDKKQPDIRNMSCITMHYMPPRIKFEEAPWGDVEFVFVVDRSGSMSGSRMTCAKDALLLFINSLIPGCHFQIIGFGSHHSPLFEGPVEYTMESREKALEYQRDMEANMGGTEMYNPLEQALSTPAVRTGAIKNVIFMTDGMVNDTSKVIALVRKHNDKARTSCIGIGEGVSIPFVSDVARMGNGSAVFLRDASRLQSEVAKIVKHANLSMATDVNVNFTLKGELSNGKTKPIEVDIFPKQTLNSFPGEFFNIFGLFKSDNFNRITGKVNIAFKISGKEHTESLDITSCLQVKEEDPDCKEHALLRLVAREQLREYLDQYFDRTKLQPSWTKRKLKETVMQIACSLSVHSPFTAFIGVDPMQQNISDDQIDFVAHISGDQIDGVFNISRVQIDCVASGVADKFTQLLNIQSFAGWYLLDEKLATIIGVDLPAMKSSVPQFLNRFACTKNIETIWATALALAFIQLAFPGKKNQYDVLLEKANAWLSTICSDSGVDVAHRKLPLEEAKEFLQKKGFK